MQRFIYIYIYLKRAGEKLYIILNIMMWNELGRQKLEHQNFWQQVKHAKLYSDLLWADRREAVWIAVDSQQRKHTNQHPQYFKTPSLL